MNAIRPLVSRVLALTSIVFLGACATNALTQARQADMTQNYDLAVAQYTKALREHPDNQEAKAGLQRAKLRASDAHLIAGRRLYDQGKLEDALLELQIAAELNPTNPDAEKAVQTVRQALRTRLSVPEGGKTQLETLLDRSHDFTAAGAELPNITLGTISTGRQVSSRDLYLMIATLANISA